MSKKLYRIFYVIAQLAFLEVVFTTIQLYGVYYASSIIAVLAMLGGLIWSVANVFLKKKLGYIIVPAVQMVAMIVGAIIRCLDTRWSESLLLESILICTVNLLLGAWMVFDVMKKKSPQMAVEYKNASLLPNAVIITASLNAFALFIEVFSSEVALLFSTIGLLATVVTLIMCVRSIVKNGVRHSKVIEKSIPAVVIAMLYAGDVLSIGDMEWAWWDIGIVSTMLAMQFGMIGLTVACLVMMAINAIYSILDERKNTGSISIKSVAIVVALTALLIIMIIEFSTTIHFIYRWEHIRSHWWEYH